MRVCVHVCGLSAVLIQANQQNYCHYSRLLPPAGQGIPWLATIVVVVVVFAYECVKIVVIYYNLRPKRSKQLTSQKEEERKKQDKRTKLGQQQQ